MISDVLSDAVGDIEGYQRDHPDAYAEFAAEIDVVKAMMDGLRMVLDSVPGTSAEKLIAELRSAIRTVDVSGPIAAQDRLLTWVGEERTLLSEKKGV